MSGMAFRVRGNRKEVQLNMTSLIDVLFLLLIFFMLTGTFKRVGEMELQLPDSSSAAPAGGESESRQIELILLEDGAVFLEGTRVPRTALGAALRDLRTQDPDATIMIKAETGAKHGNVVGLLDLVREAGFPGVGIGTEMRQIDPSTP